jgi:hypothetical protein
MIRRLVNNELERIWKEVYMTQSRYYRFICICGVRKTMEKLRKDGIPAEIRNAYLSNTNLECYRYSSLVGNYGIYSEKQREPSDLSENNLELLTEHERRGAYNYYCL